MWILRRASLPLRMRGLNMYHSGYGSMGFSVGRHELSSEAGAKDTKDEDDDDLEEEGFSVEETPVGDEGEKLLDYDIELSDDSVSEEFDIEEQHNELELPLWHDEDGVSEVKKFSRRRVESELFKAIMDAPGLSIHTALDKWVEEGKELNREEISLAMVNLRKHKMYERALQEQYAKRGDIHKTEKIFYRMKQAAYAPGLREYQVLIEAYINAKVPAHGIRNRFPIYLIEEIDRSFCKEVVSTDDDATVVS
ncbi:pentatricopeptide repeat-containing protein [Trifolium medium]|uniref:Pentatricopeptide repeat-containing protein n=1 Tax=Trifolium medium TaxID=97028 RepID=A0A392M0F9_9FABA|nr:pentatricopeptide repeat-containing protein [Trifolium medium]